MLFLSNRLLYLLVCLTLSVGIAPPGTTPNAGHSRAAHGGGAGGSGGSGRGRWWWWGTPPGKWPCQRTRPAPRADSRPLRTPTKVCAWTWPAGGSRIPGPYCHLPLLVYKITGGVKYQRVVSVRVGELLVIICCCCR